jgi:hypothetical protein
MAFRRLSTPTIAPSRENLPSGQMEEATCG